MRYAWMDNILSGGAYQALREITAADIHPVPGQLVVLRFNKKELPTKYYVGIGDDYNHGPYRNHDIIARGTWDECYPVFKFACALEGLVLP